MKKSAAKKLEEVGTKVTKDLPPVTLAVETRVSELALHLRTTAAEATLEDGTKVEIATNIDGSYLATLYPPGGKTWTTYSITPRAMVEAILKARSA